MVAGQIGQLTPMAVSYTHLMLRGEYGQKNVFVGVPCIVDRNGIRRVLELNLTDREREQFAASCDTLRESFDELGL